MSTTDVDAWLATTRNPKRDVIAAVRAVVMSDERIDSGTDHDVVESGRIVHQRVVLDTADF